MAGPLDELVKRILRRIEVFKDGARARATSR